MKTALVLIALGFAFGYLTGCSDAAPPCLTMAPESPLVEAAAPEVPLPQAWMTGRPPYVIDADGSRFPAALAAIERLNLLAGGELIRVYDGETYLTPVAVLENVNLGSSALAGNTNCANDGTPCHVQTNYRHEREQSTWMHELVHALGYRGDDPADPVHDLAGLMAAVNEDGREPAALQPWLVALLATTGK